MLRKDKDELMYFACSIFRKLLYHTIACAIMNLTIRAAQIKKIASSALYAETDDSGHMRHRTRNQWFGACFIIISILATIQNGVILYTVYKHKVYIIYIIKQFCFLAQPLGDFRF